MVQTCIIFEKIIKGELYDVLKSGMANLLSQKQTSCISNKQTYSSAKVIQRRTSTSESKILNLTKLTPIYVLHTFHLVFLKHQLYMNSEPITQKFLDFFKWSSKTVIMKSLE